MRMTKSAIALIALALTGWACAGGVALALHVEGSKVAQADAAAREWRRKAGKAYTELQRSQAGEGSPVLLVPVGATLGCAAADWRQTHGPCTAGYELPPSGYLYPPASY